MGALCEFLPLPGNRVTLHAETDRRETGVVDGDLRSFAVPNLWITDGGTLPTQGAANPALTIMALVARAAGVMVGRQPPADARQERCK